MKTIKEKHISLVNHGDTILHNGKEKTRTEKAGLTVTNQNNPHNL